MNITYKKLFDIKYNNKIFTIFIDENNRRTFLEKNEKEEYIYPTLEDFKVLNNIYNIHDPLIEYDLRKYIFKEKVRITSGVLAITVLATSLSNALSANFKNYRVDETENGVVITSIDKEPSMHLITDLKELDSVLGYTSVTKEQIIEAVSNNSNLTDYYKTIIYNLINRVYEEYPNIDLRVFYENVKTLEIREIPTEEFHEEYNNYSVANYDSVRNCINLSSNINLKTIYHELVHAMWSFYWSDYGIYRASHYSALNEAMTNHITSLLFNDIDTYINEGLILDYLMSITSYTYEDYTKYGIEGLINTLKEKYPSIDINYICECANTMKDTSLNLGVQVSFNECNNLIDELFSLSLLNIKEQNLYEAFANFVEFLNGDRELFSKYLELYNNKLLELGYEIISEDELNTITDKYQDFRNIVITNKDTYIGRMVSNESGYKLQIIDKNEIRTIDSNEVNQVVNLNKFDLKLKIVYLKYSDLFETKEFWDKLISEDDKFNQLYTKSIPIYINGEFLSKEIVNDLFLQIGLTKENKIGFVITNGDDELVYASAQSIFNISNFINLSNYMTEYAIDENKLELSYILNSAYLIEFQKDNDQAFKNLEINDHELTITPLYMLTISDIDMRSYLSYYKITNRENELILRPTGIVLDIDYDGKDISLYTILKYYGLLNEEEVEYSFTIEEIKTLIASYINELTEIKAR